MKPSLITLFLFFSVLAFSQPKNDPFAVFNELWETFNERYAGFEPRGVDWDEVKEKHQSKIHSDLSQHELFDVCCQLLSELNDAHVSLVDKTDLEPIYCNSFGFPDSTAIYKFYGSQESFLKVTDKTLMSQGFGKPIPIHEHNLYCANEKYGYIRINRMDRSYEGFAAALDKLKDKQGLIIDIRLNPGGNDTYLHKIANRLVNKEAVGHYKRTRKSGTDEFTERKTWKVKPDGPYQFIKPIVILTSDFTASGSEVFAMTLKQFPHIILVGFPTNGSMSHMSSAKLQNGWNVTISEKRTFSSEMINYEGKGVPVDVEVPVGDLEKDLTLLKALEVLQNQ